MMLFVRSLCGLEMDKTLVNNDEVEPALWRA